MKRVTLAVSALLLSVTAGAAADDPIAVRKALMQSVGASAATAGAMMKGELDYNPVVAKAAIAAINATAMAYGDFFPEGSETGDNTIASPKIWEDMAGFQAEIGKLQAATAAATQASGKDGPADLAAFQAAMGPIFGTCKACHEGYRISN